MATRVVKKLSPAELERNQAVLLNTGLAIGQHKGVYQMSSKDGRFVFRNYYPTTFNLFGVKQEDGKQFVLDVLRGIQIHHKKLLENETYATPAIHLISKTKLPESILKTMSDYRRIDFNLHNGQIKLINLRDKMVGSRTNLFF